MSASRPGLDSLHAGSWSKDPVNMLLVLGLVGR